MGNDLGVEERCDGWWVVVGDDHYYAGPFPSEDDAQYAAVRILDALLGH